MRTALTFLVTCALALAPSVLRAQTTEQTIYVSVLDKAGHPVGNLDVADFHVSEDGATREVLRAGRTSDPLDLAVIVDNSFAAQPHILDVRKALNAFFNTLAAHQTSIALIGMADRPTVLMDYTSSADALKKGVEKIFAQPGSGMVFQDSILDTLKGLVKRDNPRRAVLVITGEGTDFSNVPYKNTLDALGASGAALHVLQLTNRSEDSVRDERARERALVIDEGTRTTGGRRQELLTSMSYDDALAGVADDLANQYKVVYGRPGVLIPPKKVDVSVKTPGLSARATLVRPKTGASK
jgi:VWFA-related protein